jgi:peptidoglycan/xylan/chitin deacetylase (PgdA/CDA1 family)
MRLVSPILKHAVYPALHRIGWLDRIPPLGAFAVVNYHGVVPGGYSGDPFLDGNLVHPEVFRQHLQFLKTHYHVIHPEDFRAWVERGKQLPPRAVLVTCDDGLVNTLTDMLPMLQSEGVSCLFFVTGASSGQQPGMLWYEELYLLMLAKQLAGPGLELPPDEGSEPTSSETFQARWWSTVRRASRLDATTRADWMEIVRGHSGPIQAFRTEAERRWRLLNITELKQLAEAGMGIGAHTLSHPVLSLCSEEEARREIQESKNGLERALGRPLWAFAYPFGNPSTIGEREVRLAREAGFSCAFLNVEHWGVGSSGCFALPRTHVTMDTTLPEFAAHLSGLHTRLQRVVGG